MRRRCASGRRPWAALAAIVLVGVALAPATPDARTRRRSREAPPVEDEEPEATPRSRRGKGKKAEPGLDVPKAAPTPLDGGRWLLTSYRGADGQPVTLLEGTQLTGRFQPGRIITGSGGCNEFTAAYTWDDGAMTVSHPAITSKSCPRPVTDQEAAYLAALHRVAKAESTPESLTLSDAAGAPVLIYQREPPPVITGITWRLTAYDDGKGGFPSARRDVGVHAVFAPDGRVTGTAGCNEFKGKYTQTGDKLAMGTLILMTRKPCAAEVLAQERAFLAALRGATRIEADAGRLLLTRAGGARVASFVPEPPSPPPPAEEATGTS